MKSKTADRRKNDQRHTRSGPLLQARALEIGYRSGRRHTRKLAGPLNLTLKNAEMVCLLGPNGSGKSTLLHTLAGLLPVLKGGIFLNNTPICQMSRQKLAKAISVVLTERIQVGALPAYSVVALGRYPHTGWSGRLQEKDHHAVQSAIRAVGMEALAKRRFHELSDGEQQKVMVARALAQDSDIIILDEPTAFLDLPRRVEIMRLLNRIARKNDRGVLLSTHDLDLAMQTADNVWLLSPNGELICGAPEDMVLSGDLARVFAGDESTFDPESGGFVMHCHGYRTVSLKGEGLGAVWTRKALKRNGYEVINGSGESDILVRIKGRDKNLRWELTLEQSVSEHCSISDMLHHLNQNRN